MKRKRKPTGKKQLNIFCARSLAVKHLTFNQGNVGSSPIERTLYRVHNTI